MSRRVSLVTGLAAASLVVSTASAIAGAAARDRPEGPSFSIGLFGDLPYGDDGRAELPALIKDMNAKKLAFSIFDGDIKSGSERCDDALYTGTKAWMESLRAPVVYTPGDNDWTDCHRESNGSFDPLQRLAHLREVFFADPTHSLGRHPIRVQPQSARYPENARWVRGPATFATVHVVGSNNNKAAPGDGGRTPEAIAAANAEYRARNRANLAWIKETFASAKARGSKGVLLALQADLDFGGVFDPAGTTGLRDTVAALRREAIAFDGQVVLVHGDSHYFLVDKPLTDSAGLTLEDFTRVETFGDANTHWVTATVDGRDRNVFRFKPMIVPANVEEHTG